MNMTMVVRDINFTKRALNLIKALPEELESALTEEAKIILTDAYEHCPWETGALRASGRLGDPTVSGHDVSVPVLFGEDLTYAIYVHENLEANHPNGGEAKFLENAVNRAEKGFVGRLATRIKLERLV